MKTNSGLKGPGMVSDACQQVMDQLDRAATCTGPPQDVLSLLEEAQQLLQVGYVLRAACPISDSNVDAAMLRSQHGPPLCQRCFAMPHALQAHPWQPHTAIVLLDGHLYTTEDYACRSSLGMYQQLSRC